MGMEHGEERKEKGIVDEVKQLLFII